MDLFSDEQTNLKLLLSLNIEGPENYIYDTAVEYNIMKSLRFFKSQKIKKQMRDRLIHGPDYDPSAFEF